MAFHLRFRFVLRNFVRFYFAVSVLYFFHVILPPGHALGMMKPYFDSSLNEGSSYNIQASSYSSSSNDDRSDVLATQIYVLATYKSIFQEDLEVGTSIDFAYARMCGSKYNTRFVSEEL